MQLEDKLIIPQKLKMLKDACEEFGLTFQLVDQNTKSLARVSYGDESFWSGTEVLPTYPINSAISAELCHDKWFTNEVLRAGGFKVIPEKLVYLDDRLKKFRQPGHEIADILKAAQDFTYPVFVKPTTGTNGVFAKLVEDPMMLEKVLAQIKMKYERAVIQTAIRLPEYRLLYVLGKTIYGYRQSQAQIVGDGEKTVEDLLVLYNSTFEDLNQMVLQNDPYFVGQLRAANIQCHDVLPLGFAIKVRANSNISTGGIASEFTDQISQSVADWCERVAKQIGVQICGIDVFAPNGLQEPQDFIIIEINGNPDTNTPYRIGRPDLVKEMWKLIFQSKFPDLRKSFPTRPQG